ncbi:MAG: DUF2167 domain-containing protein [Opitutaceae bacterium]
MKSKILVFAATALALVAGLFAADPAPASPDPEARMAQARKLAASLKPQAGEIVLRDGLAKAVLPGTLRYLNSADTETVLRKIWGNPPGGATLGMLIPATFDPLASDAWAVVITFEEDGFVKDDDAAKIDYTKLLAEMKEGVREGSKERQKLGYPPIELVGWAALPRYDAAAKKLFWAKEIKFGDSAEHTLNYNIRLLGRRGVLVLNAVAEMKDLKLVEAATPSILAAVNFQEGHRYADFTEGTDKVATYGIAALVAGGIAAKTGLLKLIWVGILAFKKIIIFALIAFAASFKKIWAWIRGRSAKSEFTSSEPPAPPASTA